MVLTRPRIDGGYTTPVVTAPKTTTTSPTRTQTFQQKDAIVQSNYDAGRSSGLHGGGVTAPTTVTPAPAPFSPSGNLGSRTAPVTTPPPVAPPTQQPEVTDPTGPGGAGGGASADMLDQFTADEIEAALLALEAQYGMDRETLLQDQSLIGAQYRLLMTRLNRARVQGIEGATNDAVSRGIYRSGILGENVQTIENDYMEQARASEEARLGQEQRVQSQLDFIEANKAAEAAQIQAGLRREQANYLLQAGVSPNPGNGQFIQPGVQDVNANQGMAQPQPVGGMSPISAPNPGALTYQQLLQMQQYGMM